MLSTTSMTEERTAASAFGALALGGFASASAAIAFSNEAPSMAYGSGDVCALAIRDAHQLTPVTKAWDVRPLIPDGSGGG